MKHEILYLLPVYMLLDVILTYLAINGGYGKEANPIMTAAGTLPGVAQGIVMIILVTALLTALLKLKEIEKNKYSKTAWYFVMFAYAIVVINNAVITFSF